MNWIRALFRCPQTSINGAIVFLDTDILSDADVARIKQRMTPVFVEYSSYNLKRLSADGVQQSVTQSPH